MHVLWKSTSNLYSLGAMFEIRVEYLQAVVNEINIIYGSVEQYAEQGIGFTKDKLEERENLRERV